MPVQLSLTLVDEVIQARKTLHGGTKGAPIKLEDGVREGKALNSACIVMLSSALQAFVEDVFQACSEKAFGRKMTEAELKAYRATWSRWGNPSDTNIIQLFLRLGVTDVFDGLSWQGQTSTMLKKNLNRLNQVRNRIAHGQIIAVDGEPFSLALSAISRWRNVASQFGQRFEAHALAKIR
ncbi:MULTISPECIES: hypothetical protein [unclassified Mesorhizobium]|uniref:hypothetical protein n=1 Tax=unclassified Mesorhizobium TaxID=325217 RepID=UPI001093918F|nr:MULTISPECIES: hypothetical protein [unclassified Mesorhizobium]TGS48521.1 hypothetical protein EN825_06265 [Mesorhizobium sp. M8A.F.Ca.ET.182.01.1.1]TGS83187.1 hypothetical protein EN824_01865 [Mesorhizobium sp. M8A.F.Ca.ET.181.01.1.1]